MASPAVGSRAALEVRVTGTEVAAKAREMLVTARMAADRLTRKNEA